MWVFVYGVVMLARHVNFNIKFKLKIMKNHWLMLCSVRMTVTLNHFVDQHRFDSLTFLLYVFDTPPHPEQKPLILSFHISSHRYGYLKEQIQIRLFVLIFFFVRKCMFTGFIL